MPTGKTPETGTGPCGGLAADETGAYLRHHTRLAGRSDQLFSDDDAAGQLRWAPLTHHRVLQVLKNPAYAGAYVHGRHVTRKTVDADANVRTVTA